MLCNEGAAEKSTDPKGVFFDIKRKTFCSPVNHKKSHKYNTYDSYQKSHEKCGLGHVLQKTMILLSSDQFNLAALGLKNMSINNLFARSVIGQHVDGKVYVDDVHNPNAFYVIHPYGMSLLYGSVSNHFLHSHLKNYLLGRNGLRSAEESLQVR